MEVAGEKRKAVIAFATTFLALAMLWLASVLAALPATVVTSSWNERMQVRALLPQAWAFFTRDPQTPAIVLYEVGTDLVRADSLPQTEAANSFGISRSQRSQDTEKVFFVEAVTNWTECGAMIPRDCVAAAEEASTTVVVGVQRAPNFCGDYVVATRETTPFNYRHVSEIGYRLTQTAAVTVECS